MNIKKGIKMVNVSEIIQFENGSMPQERVVSFFQELIDSGQAWKLQGFYGRTAEHLIEEGLCVKK